MSNWKDWVIFKPIKDVYNSLFNNDNGFSYRKGMSAFACFVAYKMSLDIKDDFVRERVIYAWQIVALAGIGLVAIPELIKFLNKSKDDKQDKT